MRTSNNQITKKDLMSIYIRSLSLEYSWNYERQQHMGYCFAMLPAIKRIYEKKEAQIEAARRHMEFFNTTPLCIHCHHGDIRCHGGEQCR